MWPEQWLGAYIVLGDAQHSLTLLHTSPIHIPTFAALLAELAPDIPAQHMVDESLLCEARAAGEITPVLARRIEATILDAIADRASVVLCTCSTIGGCAESVPVPEGSVVLRVDRPMADRAVAIGTRIIVVATLQSTIAATRDLLLDAARHASKQIALIDVLCTSAWARFEQGDQHGYLTEVAGHLQQVAGEGDVIVLAQASMAAAVTLAPDLPIPVLSSPRLGMQAAITFYRLQAND